MAGPEEASTSTSSSTSTPTPKPDDNKAFDRWRRSVSWITGMGLSEEDKALRAEQRKLELEEAMWVRCEKWKADLMKNSPAVTFMLSRLQTDASVTVTSDHIHCQPCHLKRAGGFSPEAGILMCQDGFWSKKHMEDTMVHELVHLYDHARFKVDWKDLRHHACSEIRAANLSGDCRWSREVKRGFYTFSKQHQDCVRRRAILSVRSHPDCPDEAKAEKAVNEVWESCFNDTRPFDEIY